MTDRKQALTDLLEKVEAGRDLEDMFEVPASVGTEGQSEHFIEAYNGSLDAAKALHEAVLPDWEWQVFKFFGAGYVAVLDGPEVSTPEVKSADPARAWLFAILKALIAQDDDE